MPDQTAKDFVEVCKDIRDLLPEERLRLRCTSYRGTVGEYLVYVSHGAGRGSRPFGYQVGPTILHWTAEEAGLTVRDLMTLVERDAERFRVASSPRS